MYRPRFIWLIVLLLTAIEVPAARADRPGSYDGVISVHPPRSPSVPRQTGAQHGGRSPRGVGWPHHRSTTSFFFSVGPGYYLPPYYSYPYGYVPSWQYGYSGPTGIYFNPATNYAEYYLPPIYTPAELNYGPLAVERFLGLRRDVAAPARPLELPPEAIPKEVRAATIADKLRKSNAAARERAQRFVTFGDTLFLKQRCHEALQRYKSAIEAAPDLTGAYLRQGFALIAVSQYDLAARAMRIALELDADILDSGFKLDHLYGDNRLAKMAHLEQLAEAALERPRDADLLFLVGMMLHADGEPERARSFFQRAHAMAGPGGSFLTPLLTPEPTPAATSETETDV